MDDPRVVVLDNDRYVVKYENVNGLIFVHCAIKNWSLSVLKSLQKDSLLLQQMCNRDFYALNEPHGCMKHKKFLRLLGFVFFKDINTTDGVRTVYVRRCDHG